MTTDKRHREQLADKLKRLGITAVPDNREVNVLAGRRFEEDMTKTLKEQAEEWAADFWDEDPESAHGKMSQAGCRVAGAIGYMAGHDAALAGIKVDFGDLLGCCEDYSDLEADGGGTAGKSLKEMLEEAYYRGAELAVERIKEGRWRK